MFLKVCCIASPDEANLAIACGARAIGLVSEMPSGPGVIDEARIAFIASALPSSVESWLLTSHRHAAVIAEQHARCRTTAVQLTDALATPDEYTRLRRLLPATRLVQVVHVMDEGSVREAREVADFVDALLLDSGNPRLATKVLGGTGRVHDWSISARIRSCVSIPVFLAGGLRAANVRVAIHAVRPFGLDVCSGVRREGSLDAKLLEEFVTEARAAYGDVDG